MNTVKSVIKYSEINHGDKTVSQVFVKTTTIQSGVVTMVVVFENAPPSDLMDVMDSLQDMSNSLLNDEIPNYITGGKAVK